MSQPLAIYIHWPWCRHKCGYCDFNVHVADFSAFDDYVNCVVKDIEIQRKCVNQHILTSIFFGGGTPNLAEPHHIEQILDALGRAFHISSFCEVTMEMNPTEDIDVLPYMMAGVNRFSVGAQSFSNNRLLLLERQHDKHVLTQFLDHICNHCANVNLDLIYGTPGQRLSEWASELEEALMFNVKHISAYQLTIERGAAFFSRVKRGELIMPGDDDLADFFDLTREMLTDAGYENYEISNFCKPGYACAYNQFIWRYQPYLGVGAGAHGRMLTPQHALYATEVWRRPEQYKGMVQEGENVYASAQSLSDKLALQERFLAGLRSSYGAYVVNNQKRTQNAVESTTIDMSQLDLLTKHGFLTQDENRVRLTKKGWPLYDSIVEQILL
mgnify:CR=1 FL=1